MFSFDNLLNAACAVGGIFYLWRYFGFVGYDLNKFRTASTVSVLCNMVLAVGFPLVGLARVFSDETNKTLLGIGIATILLPAILPELDPPETNSVLKWMYYRTLGKVVSDFFGSCVINLLLFVCWSFGWLWVAAYAGIALSFGLGRAFWVLLQDLPDRRVAAPSLRRLFLMFAAAFGWVAFLTFLVPLTREQVHADLSDLFKPYIFATGTSWIVGRFPRFALLRWFLPRIQS